MSTEYGDNGVENKIDLYYDVIDIVTKRS